MTAFQTAPENAADIDALAEVLRAASVGETIPYTSLSTAIGRDIQRHYWLLRAAREKVETETGSLYETVRDVGVKRLTSDEVAGVGLEYIGKVRRTARRGIKRLAQIRTNDLPEGEANKLIAHRSQLGAIALVADGRKSTVVAKEAAVSGAVVPAGRVLEMFKE